jgi:hypothetical protein
MFGRVISLFQKFAKDFPNFLQKEANPLIVSWLDTWFIRRARVVQSTKNSH